MNNFVSHAESTQRVRNALERAAVKPGTVRANIAGHGSFTIRARDLDTLITEHWDDTPAQLAASVKESIGDPEYDTHGMTKIELILVLAELSGLGL